MAPLAAGLLAFLQGQAGPAAARAIGASLVAAGIDDAATVEPLLVRLQREVGTHPRGPALVAAVATGYAGALRDLDRADALRSAERFRLQPGIRSPTDHDPLTGLPTRAVLALRLQDTLERRDRPTVGVATLDLDGFQGVNDTLGHHVGDKLLQDVAQRLTDELRPDGHLVARTGGDEFVLLAIGVDEVGLRAVAGRALGAIARPFTIDGHRIVVTATVGIVPGDGTGLADAGALLQAADTTLTRAKRHGRGGVAEFDPKLHRRAVSRFALAARMADALADGEFVLEYQPLVRLADRAVVGVEALVRWDLPTGERIQPDRFVPIAEETGLIVPLGRWVLTQACTQARAWVTRRDGEPLLLSVNLAARQVREPGIVDDIAAVLADTGWPAGDLQVELTESDAMGGGASAETLRAIADMGVLIAIDDFGTGYSNLAYLRHLPVQTLKLAAPFVSGPGGGAIDAEISGLLIRLAHTLGMTVVAEAIETAEHYEQLKALGCDTGQGYYFAPPLSADAVEAHLINPGSA
jgi:diguanylate cyclase (GGDEF)-like protein